MVRKHANIKKRRTIKLFALIIIALLVLSAGFLVFRYLILQKINTYFVKDKYYSFEIKTPLNWIAEKNMAFSDDAVSKTVSDCQANKMDASSSVGMFRFQDQKYPIGFGDSGSLQPGLPSGAILQITIDCVPNIIKDQIINYNFSDYKIAGSKALEIFLYSVFGKTKSIFVYHNNFRYKIDEYVYVAPLDKSKEAEIRSAYEGVFNQIISSFKFN